ncbi:MAG TPA: SirB2 family protein [Bacteroidia bacterium]|nr:SirB2 family protein [Bacteroidia bacterium]
MATGILHTHYLVVTLFLLIYVIKTILLLSDKKESLATFTKKVKVFEMIVSFLFLATGIYLVTLLPFNGKYDYLFYIKIVMVLASIPLAVIGFKKSNKGLAVLSLLLIVGSFGIAEVYHKKKGISKDADMTVNSTNGEELYKANCVSCHGGDGKLGLSGAKDLSISSMDENGIKEIIIHGKGLMPAAQVNEEQAAAIAHYVDGSIKSH